LGLLCQGATPVIIRLHMGQQTARPDLASLTPGTLIDGARMYAASADSINRDYPNAIHVLSHVIGMSIELALKAFLRLHGKTEKELRGLGHDLEKLLAAAETCGLTATGSRHFRLAVLGANYQERIFLFPQAGVMHIILPWSLRQIANEIIQEVFIAVHGESTFDENKDAPGLCITSVYPEDVRATDWDKTTI
jgi:hypothetical protein